jgi:hypothetical protein
MEGGIGHSWLTGGTDLCNVSDAATMSRPERRPAHADEVLGVGEAITRRDFLDAALLASGGVLLSGATPLDLLAADGNEFDGYGGIGDYAGANGNTFDVV